MVLFTLNNTDYSVIWCMFSYTLNFIKVAAAMEGKRAPVHFDMVVPLCNVLLKNFLQVILWKNFLSVIFQLLKNIFQNFHLILYNKECHLHDDMARWFTLFFFNISWIPFLNMKRKFLWEVWAIVAFYMKTSDMNVYTFVCLAAPMLI